MQFRGGAECDVARISNRSCPRTGLLAICHFSQILPASVVAFPTSKPGLVVVWSLANSSEARAIYNSIIFTVRSINLYATNNALWTNDAHLG